MDKVIIKRPCSPSNRISEETIDITNVLISYDGGGGGVNITYECLDFKQLDDTFYTLTLMNGEVHRVNKRFIVDYYPITILKVVTDVTEWRNFYEKKCKKEVKNEYFKIPFNHTHIFEELALDGDKKNYKLINPFKHESVTIK